MKVTAGGNAYTFDPRKFGNRELMAVERETGMTAVEWQDGLTRGSMISVTALIWILRLRLGERAADGSGPLEFDEVEFDADSVAISGGEDEVKGSAPETSSATTPEPGPSPTDTTTTSSSS